MLKRKKSPLNVFSFMALSRETRLMEAMDNICERILQYSVHAERPGSLRYSKVTELSLHQNLGSDVFLLICVRISP